MADRTVFDELADELRGMAHRQAKEASPPVTRWKVTAANPLMIEALGSDSILEEGDPDLEIDRAVLTNRPAVGDMVRVHRDGDGYIVSGVVA